MALDQPGARDVHVDALLSNISVAYTNDEYIADKLFPIVMVQKQSDLIAGYDKGDWLRAAMQPYVPGTKGARAGFKVNTNRTYFAQGWKLGKDLPDDFVANADDPFSPFEDASRWLQEQARLRWELTFATDYFASSKGWQDKAAGTDFVAWDNLAGSNPIVDLRTQGDLIRQKTGRKLTAWTYSQKVWNVLVDHPLIVDRIKHTSKDSITPEILAALVGYETTHIGSAIYVPGQEELAIANTPAEVWGNHALGLFVPPKASLLTPSAGYTFIWKPITGTPFFFRRLRNEEEEKHILEIKSYFDMNQVDGDSGVFLENCIS